MPGAAPATAVTLYRVPTDRRPLGQLAGRQSGVVTRTQALRSGWSDEMIEAHLRSGRWQRVYPGVFATFTGRLPRSTQLWAAVLAVGRGAMLSHQTAAEVHGLTGTTTERVQITVPESRRVAPPPGVVVHRARDAERRRHPARLPPVTRVEETVIDLTQTSPNLDDAVNWLITSVAGRCTTTARLVAAMGRRRRLRWRRELVAAVADVAAGCHSALELRYARTVERAHGLPSAHRQARRQRWFDDAAYPEYQVTVELDGRAAHPVAARFRDHRRDNAAVLDGLRVLRYGFADVASRPCAVAREVAAVLAAGGWTGTPTRCRPGCAVDTPLPS